MVKYPWWKWLAVPLVLMLLGTQLGCIEQYEENPALARSEAEITGSAAIYAFYAANPDAQKGAKKLAETVATIRDVLQGFPAEGFMSLYPKIDEALKAKLTGENLVYLPLAELLTTTLLQALQVQAEKHKWADDATAATDIIAAFLTGADNALAIYAVKAASP